MSDFPTFSIIIPTYNRPARLRTCIESLTRLDYPRDRFEVIVIDDGSPEPVAPTLEPFRAQITLRTLRQENHGPATARNAGIAVAAGDLIAFIDDDCTASAGWLRGFAARHARCPDAMIGGGTRNALPENLCSTASQRIADVVYRHYNRNPDDARFIASNNMLIPTALLRSLNGFDVSFSTSAAEDRELCDRWRFLGRPIIYAPEVQICHAHWLTLRKYASQHFNYGRGAAHFHRKRAARGMNSFAPEVGFHKDVRNWIGFPLSQVRGWRKPAMFALLILWQAANALGYFYERVAIRD